MTRVADGNQSESISCPDAPLSVRAENGRPAGSGMATAISLERAHLEGSYAAEADCCRSRRDFRVRPTVIGEERRLIDDPVKPGVRFGASQYAAIQPAGQTSG